MRGTSVKKSRYGKAPVLNYRYFKGRQQRHGMTAGWANGQQACAAVAGPRYTALGARNSVLTPRLRKNFWNYEARKQLHDLHGGVGAKASSAG